MLGLKCDNRDSVHGLTRVAWRRTLGWRISGVCTLWG